MCTIIKKYADLNYLRNNVSVEKQGLGASGIKLASNQA